MFAIIAFSLLIASQVAMITMIDHDEMMAQTKGDLRIYELVNELDDGVLVYNENVHWGYSTQLSDNIGMTSFPNLGMLNGDNSLQNAATSAITSNNVSRISSMGITHAISSQRERSVGICLNHQTGKSLRITMGQDYGNSNQIPKQVMFQLT